MTKNDLELLRMTKNDLKWLWTTKSNEKSKVWPVDQRTDRRTDKAGCRVACTRLKSESVTRAARNAQGFFSFCSQSVNRRDFCWSGWLSGSFLNFCWKFDLEQILVADKRLYTLLCRSVRRSVRWSVYNIFAIQAVFDLVLLPNCVRLDCRVSGQV